MTEIDLHTLQTKKLTFTIRAYSIGIIFTVICSTAFAIFKGGQAYNQAEKYVTDTRKKVDKAEADITDLQKTVNAHTVEINNLKNTKQ